MTSILLPEVLQYFSYKYPNLAYIEVKGSIWLSEGRFATESDFFHAVDLVLNAVKKVEFKVIQIVLPKKVSLMAAMEYLSSREENIEFSIEEYNGKQKVVLNLIDVADGLWPEGFLEIFD